MLDILLGVAIFAIFIGIAGHSLLTSQRLTISSGDRLRAVSLTEEAIEAVRSIRDGDFDDLIEGTHGIRIGDDGIWEFNGSETVSSDGYTTGIVITAVDDNRYSASATTTWDFGVQRSGSVTISSTYSNWRQERSMGTWNVLLHTGTHLEDPAPNFNDIAIKGNYAFVTSEVDGGGAGLYVFDVSNLSLPTRIAEGFVLGAEGHQLLVSGDTLFVITSMPGAELQAYDISAPEEFSAGKLIDTYNIPESGKARSMAIYGTTLFVGSQQDGSQPELYSFNVSDPSDISLLDSLNDSGSYNGITLNGGYAYIANSEDVAELTVIDVFDPSNLQFAPGIGYNLTDVPDGRAVVSFENSVAIGRSVGDVIQELALFDIADSPVPSPPPGPWYRGVGTDVHDMDRSATGKYIFVATEHESAEVQVIDSDLWRAGQMPLIASYDTDTGIGRGLIYDPIRDRLFAVTISALLIFSPNP